MAVVEIGYRLRRNGVHDIADEHDAARYRYCLVDEGEVVAFRIVAGRDFCLLEFQHVVPSLCKAEEQRQQECHHNEPVGYQDAGCRTAGCYAQEEAHGEYAEVDDGDAFQAQAVCHLHQPVYYDDIWQRQRRGNDLVGQRERHPDAQGEHEEHEHIAHGDGNLAAGDGTMALLYVAAVVFYVDDVVEAVYAGGDEREGKECHDAIDEQGHVHQLMPEKEGHEDEEVLDPLIGAQNLEYAFYH